MTNKQLEIIGWLGFGFIISAYLFATLQFLSINSTKYQVLNLLGALCLIANAKHKNANPLVWLNIVWALVAIFGLVKQLGIR